MPTKRILGNSIKNISYFSSASRTSSEPMTRSGEPSENRQSRTVTSQSYYAPLGGSGINYTSPGFYSPQHTPSSWQIPTTRTEVYKWNTYFTRNEGRIRNGISFYSEFPINSYELDCPNAAVKEYFEKLDKKLNLSFYLSKILREYYGMGDAFVMMEIDCDKCQGQGVTEDGDDCDHAGATWSGISILDPLTVEVVPIPLSHEESRIYMMPNNELKRIVNETRPKEVYNRIPDALKRLVKSSQKIPLDPLTITHFKHDAAPYETYGTSLIRPLFPTLAYKDKLRQAQWIVAERHILPIRVAKIGSDNRPANQHDIDDTQNRLAEIANDPISTLVTYHDFELEFVGACFSEDTEVLTDKGFKRYEEVCEDDLIACYNPENKQLEYHKYIEKYEYDYDSDDYGPMINFSGKHYDTMVTPNHMMWINKNKEWNKIKAEDVKAGVSVLSSIDWGGKIPEKLPYSNVDLLSNVSLDNYLKFIGYYLSEGSLKPNNEVTEGYCTTHIYQKPDTESCDNIEKVLIECFGEKLRKSFIKQNNDICTQFRIHNTQLAGYLKSEFGLKSFGKNIPRWILNLPKEKLELLLETMVEGDGDITKSKIHGMVKYRYSTVSRRLADNVQEILLKLGFNPKITIESRGKTNKSDNPLPVYRVYWTANKPETRGISKSNIKYVDYHGSVWCFEVPTGLFITRRNKKIGIHGNSGKVLQLTNEMEMIENEMVDGIGLTKAIMSGEGPAYSNAQAAIEVVIKRLMNVQNMIAHWMEERVFKPIAEFNGFTHKNRRGETEYIYPTVRFEDLKLRDNTNKLQLMWQARQNGDLSARTFIEEGLGFNLDNEIENMRLESMSEMFASPNLGLGTGGVDGGGYGGGGPAMPPEMGGMPPMGGGMPPPGPGEAPPGGAPPGAPPGGGAPGPMAPSAGVLYENYMKVVADSKKLEDNTRLAASNYIIYDTRVTGFGRDGILPEEPDFSALSDVTDRWGYNGCLASQLALNSGIYDKIINIRMAGIAGNNKNKMQNPFQNVTKLEAKLHQAILGGRIPSSYYMQYAVNGDRRFIVDGAFPDLKIAVEADGETWHIDQDKMQKDRYRDTQLASQGWMVLRFTEDEIEEQIQDVLGVIMKAVNMRNQNQGVVKTVAFLEGEMRKIAEDPHSE